MESHAADSLTVDLLPVIARTDWLEGDTVMNFTERMRVPWQQGSGSGTPELEVEEIIAIGNALDPL